MSKKILFSAVITLLSMGMYAQTIVGTTPENRNVVLEEFTGINCVYCPQGHAIAQTMKDENPEDVFLVNIHTGGFATPATGQPDFRTPFGAAIAVQSQLAGYPAGTVNRENFPGSEQNGAPDGATGQGRGTWVSTAAIAMAETSYLNVAVESTIDMSNNQMAIHVETYYTGDSPEATNKLNVYILQNLTEGPQSGGGAGNNYIHQHRLIDMPLGQWGADITNTTAGSFDDRTIDYTIPSEINGIEVKLEDIEVVVSVAEGNQYIVSGSGAAPLYTNVAIANDVDLIQISDIKPLCLNDASTTVKIRNLGQNTITNLNLLYSVNGAASQTFNYTGNVTSFQFAEIELPITDFDLLDTNTLSLKLPEDDDETNNELTQTFEKANSGAGNVTVTITTDQYSDETSWRIYNSSGDVVENGTGGSNYTTTSYDVQLDTNDCYTFELRDAFGDGINGTGGASLEDINGVVLLELDGSFTFTNDQNFFSDGVLGTADLTFEGLSIYPNPAQGFFNIVNAENANVTVYDIQGRQVSNIEKISNNERIETNNIQAGTYFVSITKEGFTTTEKLIIK